MTPKQTSAILKNVAQYIIINGVQARRLFSVITPKLIEVGELLFQPGDICNQEIFICKGSLALWEMNENGEKREIMSAGKNEWFTDRYSFISEKPTNYFLGAKTDVEILVIEKKDFRWLYRQVPLYQEFFRNVLEKSYLRLEEARRMVKGGR